MCITLVEIKKKNECFLYFAVGCRLMCFKEDNHCMSELPLAHPVIEQADKITWNINDVIFCPHPVVVVRLMCCEEKTLASTGFR